MREKICYWIMKGFGLNWIAYNYQNNYGDYKIVITRYCSNKDCKQDILKKKIPRWFQIFVKILHPRTKLEVKKLTTEAEIKAEMAWYVFANSAY